MRMKQGRSRPRVTRWGFEWLATPMPNCSPHSCSLPMWQLASMAHAAVSTSRPRSQNVSELEVCADGQERPTQARDDPDLAPLKAAARLKEGFDRKSRALCPEGDGRVQSYL